MALDTVAAAGSTAAVTSAAASHMMLAMLSLGHSPPAGPKISPNTIPDA